MSEEGGQEFSAPWSCQSNLTFKNILWINKSTNCWEVSVLLGFFLFPFQFFHPFSALSLAISFWLRFNSRLPCTPIYPSDLCISYVLFSPSLSLLISLDILHVSSPLLVEWFLYGIENCLLLYNVPCLCHPRHSFQFPGVIYPAIRPLPKIGFAEKPNAFILPLQGLLLIIIQRSSGLLCWSLGHPSHMSHFE